MSQVSTYSNPAFSSPLRVLTIDEAQWFVAMDVAKALGFRDPSGSVHQHCIKSRVLHKNQMVETSIRSLFAGSIARLRIIPESDLYRLVMRSDLPSAQRFQEWVTSEVLPSLKKTGSYSVPAVQQHQAPVSQAQLLLSQAQMLVDIENRQAAQEADIKETKDEVASLRRTIESKGAPAGYLPISQIRLRYKTYGMSEATLKAVFSASDVNTQVYRHVSENGESVWATGWAIAGIQDLIDEVARTAEQVTAQRFIHPKVTGRFQLIR